MPEERASVDADASSIADSGRPFDGPPDVAEAGTGTTATAAEVMTRVNAARVAAALRTAGRRPESR
ncbi:hypothetical protein GCM10023194_16120 [Planotetraspora phitsanulokensis]|uniref:Uncharacterized protein n=1 Tax=Planotetraspora phitsanulokensis TaxID=575192 RepID=A0A8J3U8D8_9ACTN|nr:hypothetical protein Pph01_37790 [Planotetraspora phitsanulokensis]